MSLAQLPPGTDIRTPTGRARLDATLAHVVTDYDRRELARSLKPGRGGRRGYYNPYALPQYLQGVQHAGAALDTGQPLRAALLGAFCGRLLDHLLRAVGEDASTREEQRGGF